MPPTKQRKVKIVYSKEKRIDDFNTFALNYRGYNGETFFILQGTQIVQNYRCLDSFETVMSKYREQL